MQPSSELALRMQNAVTQRSENGVSIFARYTPATPQRVAEWVATMAACFPQMGIEFWTIAGKMVSKDGLSLQRLLYIQDTLLRTHKYPTLTMADILSCDKYCKIWSFDEFYRAFNTTRKEGYCILAQPGRDGKIQFAPTEEAKKAGFEIIWWLAKKIINCLSFDFQTKNIIFG